MFRFSVREVSRVLQTPLTFSRSMFRFTIREVVLVTTIVALVGGLLLERRQHAETQHELDRVKHRSVYSDEDIAKIFGWYEKNRQAADMMKSKEVRAIFSDAGPARTNSSAPVKKLSNP